MHNYQCPLMESTLREVPLILYISDRKYKGISVPSKIIYHDGSINGPYGIAFSKGDTWGMVDFNNNCVCIFNGQDHLVKKLGRYGNNASQFYNPRGAAFDSNDHFYNFYS